MVYSPGNLKRAVSLLLPLNHRIVRPACCSYLCSWAVILGNCCDTTQTLTVQGTQTGRQRSLSGLMARRCHPVAVYRHCTWDTFPISLQELRNKWSPASSDKSGQIISTLRYISVYLFYYTLVLPAVVGMLVLLHVPFQCSLVRWSFMRHRFQICLAHLRRSV